MDIRGILLTYFESSEEIRTAFDTINAIDATHEQIKKVTITKEAFTSD